MFELDGEYRQPASRQFESGVAAEKWDSYRAEPEGIEINCSAPLSQPLLPRLEILASTSPQCVPKFRTADGECTVNDDGKRFTAYGAAAAQAGKFKHREPKKKLLFDPPRYLSPGAAPIAERGSEDLSQPARRVGETRNVLVSEIAFAFMLSLAGASRRRPDMELKISDHDDEAGATPRDPARLNLPAQAERQPPSEQNQPPVNKFSWTRAPLSLATTDYGIAFDAGAALAAQSSIFSGTDLQSQLAAASVASWWRGQNGQRKDDSTGYAHTKTPVEARKNTRVRTTMIVGLTDTLAEVARELFHDESLAWLIADLNKGSIQEHTINGKRIVRLKHRQEIVLPNWADVVEFNNARPEISRSIQLVTIVEKTRVDIDLIKLGLTKVVGSSDKPST